MKQGPKTSEEKDKNKQENSSDEKEGLNVSSGTGDDKKTFMDSHPVLSRITKYFLVPALTFILGLFSHYILQYHFPKWFNKADITIMPTDISSVDQSILLKSGVEPMGDTLSRYKAIINQDEGAKGIVNEYSLICGDASNPGCGDIVLRLFNRGTSQAIIKRFEIELLEYQPLGDVAYSIQESSSISKPDEYIVLYGSIDPLISNTCTWSAKKSEKGEELKVSLLPIATSLSPKENGAYYLRTSFLKYGMYKLNFKVYYSYAEKNAFSVTSEPVYILYDNSERLDSKIHGDL